MTAPSTAPESLWAGTVLVPTVMQRGTKIVVALIVVATVFTAVTLYAIDVLQQSFRRQLLVVRATAVLATDATEAVPADFGPHCAQGIWAQSGALIVESDVLPTDATGVVYVRYEASGTFTSLGGDRVALFFFRTGDLDIAFASPVNASLVLFTLTDRNSAFLVDGTEYGAGQPFQGAYTTTATVGAQTWQVSENYTITSLGRTTVTVQPPQPCM